MIGLPLGTPAALAQTKTAVMAQRILIVEDEPAFAAVLSELLSEEGYVVLRVRDAGTALNMLNVNGCDGKPDMVVCDVMLPGLHGDRFAEEVRRRFPKRNLPILLMSATSDPHVVLPHVEFVGKPFETAELLRQVDRMLASVGAR